MKIIRSGKMRGEVAAVFDGFPGGVRTYLEGLRELILEVGSAVEPIGRVEESLKWGEPSYATLAGSPVRLGWSEKEPEKVGVYFHCQTKLVSTFREVYPEVFTFEGNRGIVFSLGDVIPEKELRHCLELAFTYHRRKKLPLLGVDV